MIFANVFFSLAIFLNTFNIVNFNEKSYKNQLSVEKNDFIFLKSDDNSFDFEKISPKYFLDSQVNEIRLKGMTPKSFEKNFDEFYEYIGTKIKFLEDEITNLNENSQAYTSEYIFQRKNHILCEIENFKDYINEMDMREKRKIICYEYINSEIDKYDGVLGFSIICHDKDEAYFLGTIVMPDYIGELECSLTSKSIDLYRNKYKNFNNIYTIPLSYFDRYFLNTVGFR